MTRYWHGLALAGIVGRSSRKVLKAHSHVVTGQVDTGR
jgi:hypothetical protein